MLIPLALALSVVSATDVAWIRVVPYEESEGELRRLYDVVKGASGHLDNVVKVHSLRPHTLEGHYGLYRSVLHHPGNEMPPRLLESLGVYTSVLNGCDYGAAHHSEGLRLELADDARFEKIHEALSGRRRARTSEPRASGVRAERSRQPECSAKRGATSRGGGAPRHSVKSEASLEDV